ncbi:MAG: hypothetical protein ACJ76I_07015 [Gaiellaceae bacterium]
MATRSPSADGPRPSRHDETRFRNARIANTARKHRLDGSIAVPFLCECSDERCDELIRLTLSEYSAARSGDGDYLVAPGHQVESAEIVRVKDDVWMYRRSVSAS